MIAKYIRPGSGTRLILRPASRRAGTRLWVTAIEEIAEGEHLSIDYGEAVFVPTVCTKYIIFLVGSGFVVNFPGTSGHEMRLGMRQL
jgi:hypothetical protein